MVRASSTSTSSAQVDGQSCGQTEYLTRGTDAKPGSIRFMKPREAASSPNPYVASSRIAAANRAHGDNHERAEDFPGPGSGSGPRTACAISSSFGAFRPVALQA